MKASRSSKASWYWNRLRSMSADEVARRIVLARRKQRWRRRSYWNAPAARVEVVDEWSLGTPSAGWELDTAAVLREADTYLTGSFALLNTQFDAADLDWHTDPQLGIRAPVTFGPDLDYRDTAVAGNVKNIWELNRHQHLTLLALAYALDGQERYADAVARQLESWVGENPMPLGVNWHSALELGVRLISWVWIERLLRGSDQHARLFGAAGTLWPAVYWHQWLIRRHLSHGSSANNHLVGELAGLFAASTVWPFFSESGAWRRVGRRGLEREIARQTFESGLNREQAFSYHLFALELFMVAGLEAERAGAPLSENYKTRVRRMTEVLPPLTDVGGNLPRFGDADDALGVQLRARASSPVDYLSRLANRWAGASVPEPDTASGLLPAQLMWSRPPVGRSHRERPDPRAAAPASHAFDDAGVYVLSSQRNTLHEIFCIADAGPLGFLSICAHGHADALAFTMSVGGQPVIVDVGTFSYFLDPHWRDYFRGTKAHNTVTVAEQDQSVAGGPFLWTRKARCRAVEWRATPNGARLTAEHDGYRRLPGVATHSRSLHLDDDELRVSDRVGGSGRHALEWRLHFHPDCSVELAELTCTVSWQSGELVISLDRQLDWSLREAQDDAGWYSAGFNLREPTTTLVGAAQLVLPAELRHTIEVHHRRSRSGASTPETLP